MYKKIVSCLLTVTILISNSSSLFGLDLPNISDFLFDQNPSYISEDGVKYKPASSFEYEYFIFGETNEEDFRTKLEEDIHQNLKDAIQNPEDYKSNFYKNASIQKMATFRESKAYNDFLYYNYQPKESPYWKWTAFEPDNEATEEDVLLIIKKQKKLSKKISDKLKEEPGYEDAKRSQHAIQIGVVSVIAIASLLVWKYIPVIAATMKGATGSAAVAATAGAATKGLTFSKVASFLAIMLVDIFISEEIAYQFRKLEGIKENLDDIDIYEAVAINNQNETSMLSTHLQSKDLDMCSEAIDKYKKAKQAYIDIYSGKRSGRDRIKIIEEQKKWGIISEFCQTGKLENLEKDSRMAIGEYLISQYYKNTEYPEAYITQARETMLRFYYASLFIYAELSNDKDRLRFYRAFIDTITVYKLAIITIKDEIIRKMSEKPRIVNIDGVLKTKGITDADWETVIYEDKEGKKYTLENSFAQNSSPYFPYPELLPRAQVNYIVQRMDMEYQKKKGNEWDNYYHSKYR